MLIKFKDILRELADEYKVDNTFPFSNLIDDKSNKIEYNKLINNEYPYFKLIGKYNGLYDIYHYKNDPFFIDFFVDNSKNLIIFASSYNMFGDMHVECSVWHHKNNKGLAKEIYKNYYFANPKCKSFVSDNKLSDKAFNSLWKDFIKYAIDNGYGAVITDSNLKNKIPLDSVNYDTEMNNNYVKLSSGGENRDIPINGNRFKIFKKK